MTSPYFLAIRGKFVIQGYEPDGDSVRFIPDQPALLDELRRSYKIRPSHKDGSVQLRFDGVDATELHYGSAAQPLGKEARDALLPWMNFTGVTYSGTKVTHSQPATVEGAILTAAADVHGRPVSYALVGHPAKTLRDGEWTHVDHALLTKTLNYKLAETGTAYITLYTSMPAAHRKAFHQAAKDARDKAKGVWGQDTTSLFTLTDQASIGPQGGQVILPKLFRRATDYLKAVDKGFRGDLPDWIRSTVGTASNENDRVLIHGRTEVHLADLLEQRNDKVSFQADLLDIMFVEK